MNRGLGDALERAFEVGSQHRLLAGGVVEDGLPDQATVMIYSWCCARRPVVKFGRPMK